MAVKKNQPTAAAATSSGRTKGRTKASSLVVAKNDKPVAGEKTILSELHRMGFAHSKRDELRVWIRNYARVVPPRRKTVNAGTVSLNIFKRYHEGDEQAQDLVHAIGQMVFVVSHKPSHKKNTRRASQTLVRKVAAQADEDQVQEEEDSKMSTTSVSGNSKTGSAAAKNKTRKKDANHDEEELKTPVKESHKNGTQSGGKKEDAFVTPETTIKVLSQHEKDELDFDEE